MYVLFLKDVTVKSSGYSARKGDIEYIANSQHTNCHFLYKDGRVVMSFQEGSDSYILCSSHDMLVYLRDTGQIEKSKKWIEETAEARYLEWREEQEKLGNLTKVCEDDLTLEPL